MYTTHTPLLSIEAQSNTDTFVVVVIATVPCRKKEKHPFKQAKPKGPVS